MSLIPAHEQASLSQLQAQPSPCSAPYWPRAVQDGSKNAIYHSIVRITGPSIDEIL